MPSNESLVNDHLDALYGLAKAWTRDEDLAQDLTHRTFLKAFEMRGKLKNPSSVRAWLITVLRNELRSDYRKKRREADLTEKDCPDESTSEVDFYCDEEVLRALPGALNLLPDFQKDLLLLRFQQDLSYEDISKVLGLPLGTVMSRLHRAKQALRTRLESLFCIPKGRVR